jgi:hypothetical protein
MPHIDELLGVTTIAAAGLFAAIAVQPSASGPAAAPGGAPIARVASIDVVARRSVEFARIEREEGFGRESLGNVARPDA